MRNLLKGNLLKGSMLGGCAVVMLVGAALIFSGRGSNLGYLVLLLCPLMHLFMHRHHHSEAHGGTEETKPPLLLLEHRSDGSARTTAEDTQD